MEGGLRLEQFYHLGISNWKARGEGRGGEGGRRRLFTAYVTKRGTERRLIKRS